MPKFAPNTGFKMPGVGSKNIDSPGNFRDEQHVDKVGYCDTTDDRMLPEGSSPLKVRYASSGYLKDLDAIQIPQKKKKESVVCPKGSTLVDGKCVADDADPVVKKDTPPPPPTTTTPPTEKDVADATSSFTTRTRETDTTPDKANFSGGGKIENDDQKTWMTGEKNKIKKANPDYTTAQVTQAYRNKYKIGKSTTTKGATTTVYKVNGKVTDKAGYDAAGPKADRQITKS